MRDDLQVHLTHPDGQVIVEVTGEVDMATAPRLQQVMDDLAAGCRVRLDLGGVTFMDSSGLKVLASTLNRLRAGGGELLVSAASPQVSRVLDLAGLSEALRAQGADSDGGDHP